MDFPLNIENFTIAPHSISASRLILKEIDENFKSNESGDEERVLYKRCNIHQGHKEICLYTHIYLNIHLNNACASLY